MFLELKDIWGKKTGKYLEWPRMESTIRRQDSTGVQNLIVPLYFMEANIVLSAHVYVDDLIYICRFKLII